MAAGDATSRLAPINPSNLIGLPDTTIVEPRAVAMLADAFRQGVVSAEDVVDRIGKLGQTRKKAELMQLEEQISPEAQALRQQQRAAGQAQAGLAEAEALRAQVLQKHPAVAYFDELAPAAGVETPTLPDGSPDYAQMERLGAELLLDKRRKDAARAKKESIKPRFDDVTRVVSLWTAQGEPVDPSELTALDKIINSPFTPGQPAGTFQAPAAAAPTSQVAPQVAPTAPQVAPTAPQVAPTAPQISPVSQTVPAPVVEARPAVGTPVAGGFSMGPLPAPATAPKDELAQSQAAEKARAIIPTIDSAIATVAREGTVGPLAGSLPVQIANRLGAAFGLDDRRFQDQRELQIAISNKILEGAQQMKGNLSDKDVRFLRESVPALSDPPALWNRFLNQWRQMAETNIAILEGRLPKPTGDIFAPPDFEGGRSLGEAAATAQPIPSVNSPAEAPTTSPIIRDARTGKTYKNPNYRP